MTRLTLAFLAGIVTFGIILRIINLGSIPRGVTNDEVGYIYNAYSLAKTGRNVFSERFPLFTYIAGYGIPSMPVPTTILALTTSILPLTTLTGRLPNVLMGSISIILLFFIIKRIFHNETIALLSAFSLSLSPWHIFFSRTAYDIPVAAFFYLVVIFWFIWETENKQLPVLSPLFFSLALFSYRGMTPIAIGFIPFLLWMGKRLKKLTTQQMIRYAIMLLGITGIFVILALHNKSKGFLAEATPHTQQEVSSILELSMRGSQGPQWLKRIYLNKPTYYTIQWITNYLDGYSPSLLFLRGENSQIYSMWLRGKLYLIDIIFLLFGIYYLFHTRRDNRHGIFVFVLFVISGIPGLVGGQPYGTRNFFMTIPLAILSGCGIYQLVQTIRWKKIGIFIITVMYIYSVSHFLFDYYSYAYVREESWFFSQKQLASLISQASQPPGVVMAGTSFYEVLQYAFYTHVAPRAVQQAWLTQRTTPINTMYSLGSVTFSGSCRGATKKDITGGNPVSLLIVRPECLKETTPSAIIKDYDGNTVWKIYK